MLAKLIERLSKEEKKWCGEKDKTSIICNAHQQVQPLSSDLGFCSAINGNMKGSNGGVRQELQDSQDFVAVTQFTEEKSAYYVHEFDAYCSEEFLEVAYRVVLGRTPDPEGFKFYLEHLRSGHFTRDEVLGLLRFSPEGRMRSVNILGLKRRYLVARARHLPVIGFLFNILYGIASLPRIIRRLEHIHDVFINKCREVKDELPGLQNRFSCVYSQFDAKISDIEHRLDLHLDQSFANFRHQLNSISANWEQNFSSLLGRIDILENHIRELSNRTTTLRQAVLLLEKRVSSSHDMHGDDTAEEPLSPFAYAFFEDDFRGSLEKVKEGLSLYVPLIKSSRCILELPIVDLGCGRGEWLSLLKDEGLHAIGVDINEVAISFLEKDGLSFVKDDIFAFLQRSSPESFSAVTAFHVIEHLPPEKWMSFLSAIFRVLAPGGVAILETPNPRHLLVASGDFYRDPTHLRPVFPDTLEFLGEITGFVESTAWFFDAERTRLIPAKDVKFNTLQDYLNVSRDFAWSGRKPSR